MATQPVISTDSVNRLLHAVAKRASGEELANALNNAQAAYNCEAGQLGSFFPALVIVATSTSTTTNFATLAVGDLVVVIPAAAGNSHFVTVVTLGTLPEAAVIGSLYVALRPVPVLANPSAISSPL